MRGEIDERDGVLRIVLIHVHYRIRIPDGKREAAERALERHMASCPVAQTLTPCVEITWEAEIEAC